MSGNLLPVGKLVGMAQAAGFAVEPLQFGLFLRVQAFRGRRGLRFGVVTAVVLPFPPGLLGLLGILLACLAFGCTPAAGFGFECRQFGLRLKHLAQQGAQRVGMTSIEHDQAAFEVKCYCRASFATLPQRSAITAVIESRSAECRSEKADKHKNDRSRSESSAALRQDLPLSIGSVIQDRQ